MQLSKESKTASLYRWYYATSRMPQSLCPYFWKVVLMYLTIIPYTILSLPYMIFNGKDKSGDYAEKPITGLFMYIALGLALSMLWSISILFVGFFPKDSFAIHIQILGILLWAVGIALGAWHGTKWLIERHKRSKIRYDENGYRIWEPVQPKEPNLVVEFVKATYNKYCPKIDWTTSKTSENEQ